MIDPRRGDRVSVKKSEASQKVLDDLDKYIEGNFSEPMKWIVGLWRDQAAVITYGELMSIVTDEDVPKKIFNDWFGDYSRFLSQKITPMWQEAMNTAVKNNPLFAGVGEGFDATDYYVNEWITTRSAELVTFCLDEQRKAIRYIIGEGKANKWSISETARYIRPTIGLTEQQAAANQRYYNTVKEQMRENHPRMTNEAVERKAREAAGRYAAKQQRTRAETIARTEMATAYNEGYDQYVRQAMRIGLLPVMRKVWATAKDGHVCGACEDLEGVEVGMDEQFKVTVGKRVHRELATLRPPLHPRCKCVIMYEETGEKADTENYEDITDEWRKNYATGIENVSEAQEYRDDDGKIYKVDGRNVKQEHTEHEKDVGKLLSRATRQPVTLVPEVKGDFKNVHTPDYLVGSSRSKWDLKDITTDNKEAIRNAAHKKKKQANNFIFNVTGDAVTEHVITQAENAFSQYNMGFVKSIAVIREDKILRVLRRKKGSDRPPSGERAEPF